MSIFEQADTIVRLNTMSSEAKTVLTRTGFYATLRRGAYLTYLQDGGMPSDECLDVLAEAVIREHAKRNPKDPLPKMPYKVDMDFRSLADADGNLVISAPHSTANVNGSKGADILNYFAKCGTADVRYIVESGLAPAIAEALRKGLLAQFTGPHTLDYTHFHLPYIQKTKP